jgi:hypothetical protein
VSELEKLEGWMASLIRRRRDLSVDPDVRSAALRHIHGNDRLSPAELLEIYREQFWLRHTASLLEDFPGLSALVGQAAWERLVEGYIEEHAPSSWSLRNLGNRLPEFVERSVWLEHHELCVDMARLEWSFIEIFDAPDTRGLDPEKLAALTPKQWETARIVLSPALALLRVRHPVADLRLALSPSSGKKTPIPEPSPSCLVLYRGSDRNLHHSEVSSAAFELLRALKERRSLVAACESAAIAVPDEAAMLGAHVGEWFRAWGDRGWVVDVEVG